MSKIMIKCIVKNDIYEVASFEEDTSPPDNTVIVNNSKWFRIYREYELTNGVKTYLKASGAGEPSVKTLLFSSNDILLKELKTRNFQSFADYLNMFHNMEQEELDAYILKAQNKTKTALEEEIEELKLQKVVLEEELETFLEIQQKRKEIKKLIKKLES
jgi:uncharacterized protein YdcH (DUF465 family)